MTIPTKILHSTTTGNSPASMVVGQIAINEADGKLFYRDASGNVQFQYLSIVTNSVANAVTRNTFLSHRTTGTPAIGIGAGLQFEVQTAATPTYKIGGAIDCVSTNITSGTEAFDLRFSTMTAGTLTERQRLDGAGNFWLGGNYTYYSQGSQNNAPTLNVSGTAPFGLTRWGGSEVRCFMCMSASATIGTMTALTSGSGIAQLTFCGTDGTGFQNAARFYIGVDATPTTGHVPGYLSIQTSSATADNNEVVRFDHNGYSIFSGGAGSGSIGANLVEMHRTTQNGPLSLYRWDNSSNPTVLVFNKSAGTTIGTMTTISGGAQLGQLSFYGVDASATPVFQQAAAIIVQNDVAPTAGSVSGLLLLQVSPSGSGTPQTRLKINSDGKVVIGTSLNSISGCWIDVNTSGLQNSTNAASLALNGWGANNSQGTCRIAFNSSRNTTVGSHTVVAASDAMGALYFYGSDGTGFQEAGHFECDCDITPTTGHVPGRFSMWLSSASANSECLRVVGSDKSAWHYGNVYMQNNMISLLSSADTNHGIIYNSSVNGPEFRGFAGFRWATGSSGATQVMYHDGTNLGISNMSTTSNAASAYISTGSGNTANQIFRSTSSLRYKKDIDAMPAERISAVAACRLVEFTSTCEKDDPMVRHVGYIAEEVAEIDPHLVTYNVDGQPEGVMYERVLLLKVAALEQEIANLKNKRGRRH